MCVPHRTMDTIIIYWAYGLIINTGDTDEDREIVITAVN